MEFFKLNYRNAADIVKIQKLKNQVGYTIFLIKYIIISLINIYACV